MLHLAKNTYVREAAYGANSANKMFPGDPETWRHVVAMLSSTQMFRVCFIAGDLLRSLEKAFSRFSTISAF